VLSRILMVDVRDDAAIDAKRLHIDALKLDLVGRMAGSYPRTVARIETATFQLKNSKPARTKMPLRVSDGKNALECQ
jgi:hypothetical protein